MSSLKLLAYAKVNLYLAVYDKRPDGYHDIKSIIQNISLYDELTFEESDRFEVVSNLPIKPKENLVSRAAFSLMDAVGQRRATINLNKNILIAAGLGGGSSDAAATLIGLNKLWNLDLSREDLMEHAAKLGADVPFFLVGGTALVEGIGERVTPLQNETELLFVIAKPQYGILSHEAYQRFDEEPALSVPPIDELLSALEKGDIEKIADNMSNMLEPSIIKGHPQIQTLKEKALGAGALAAMLSGSGSSVFCLVDSLESAKKIEGALKQITSDVFTVQSRNFSVEEICKSTL